MRERTLVEATLGRDRLAVALVLLVVPAAGWTWIVLMARDMYGPMTGPSAWMMSLVWDWPRLTLLWAMWAVMMAAMMLPAATPIVMLYARAARTRETERGAAARIYALAAGYVTVWAVFSVAATIVQRVLARSLVLTPMMEPATATAGAAVLALAGLYQFTPLKRVCLRACRSPIAFLGAHWHPGVPGAMRMGVEHGLYCVGCCWALMLVLFAGGVMNLTVILVLTAWVVVEKMAPFGEPSARVAGALLLAGASWMVLR